MSGLLEHSRLIGNFARTSLDEPASLIPTMPVSLMEFCEPHRERGLSVPAEKIAGQTPMCGACFAGEPISRTSSGASKRVRRKGYGIRTQNAAEQICRRRARIRRGLPVDIERKMAAIPAAFREEKPKAEPGTRHGIRHNQILALMVSGSCLKEIARALGISESTVKFHIHNLYKKSGTRDRTSLVLWHLRNTGALAPAPEISFAPSIDPAGTDSWRRETSA